MRMDLIQHSDIENLIKQKKGTCISIFMPTPDLLSWVGW